MKRREFIRLNAAGTFLSAAASWSVQAEDAKAPGEVVREAARDIPVAARADVVVCGAGPAGVCAALAAARKGARTLLLEAHGSLGGIWTTGLLSYFLDFSNKPGIMREIVERATKLDGRAFSKKGAGTNAFDPEIIKIVLEDLCGEAGVQVQYHSRVCAAVKHTGGRLTHVITESKSGREAVQGGIFVDCTGDGDVAAQAGCQFDLGNPETGALQPMSLIALVTGIVTDEIQEYFRDSDSAEWAKPKDALNAEMTRGGRSPSYAKPSLFRVREGLFILMSNHEYGVKGTNVREVTQATLRARRELHDQINGLRSLGGPWKNIRLVATPAQIGVREGRRIHGLYTVVADDLREGRNQPDAVCTVTFPVDVHATNPNKEKGIEKSSFRTKPYEIPLRALIAKDVTGLMMAGRCISGDFIAHSSYRVTGNAAAMGEAAGKTAALAAKSDRLPQNVKITEL
ncbi:MAG: FAD-dependent oxidoreductase [Verrucomicrobiota bacterium]